MPAEVNPTPLAASPNRIAVPPSGIYIVTLNNSELISTQAHDRRYDGKAVLMVNHQHVKFGSAIDLTGRMEYGYYQTFGQHNVNFIPVVATDQFRVLESDLKEKFRAWRLRSPAGVLTEWTCGIDAQVMIEMILATAIQLNISHSVIRRIVLKGQ